MWCQRHHVKHLHLQDGEQCWYGRITGETCQLDQAHPPDTIAHERRAAHPQPDQEHT